MSFFRLNKIKSWYNSPRIGDGVMSIKNKKGVVYFFRVLGFVLLVVGLFLILNVGRAWFSWSKDRSLYNEVTATREDLTVIYHYNNKEYIVDTIIGNSYKPVDLNELFKKKEKVTLYCEKEDYSSCVYLDYNYTSPVETIVLGIVLAFFGSFLAFPNRFINGYLYAKETVKKGKEKRLGNKNKKKTTKKTRR